MGGASAFNTAQNEVVGFVKATAADDGHDADHVHLVLFSLNADITPTGVLLATFYCFWCVFFVGLVSELVFFSWDFVVFEALCELVHTQGGQCGNQIGATLREVLSVERTSIQLEHTFVTSPGRCRHRVVEGQVRSRLVSRRTSWLMPTPSG